jgi:hypothetical protein
MGSAAVEQAVDLVVHRERVDDVRAIGAYFRRV